jgi:peptidoglycan/LPS O-acetylase OafA/YrhL
MDQPHQVGGIRSFLPAVEGMRACAAIGVVITHVAFQTGHSVGVDGRLFGRFDLAVAVFFALSGFLLWRGHAAAARGLGSRPSTGHYLRSRVVRIMPAYLVAVVVILTLLPDADHPDLTVWLANLSLTQVYVPLTLTHGLTQMWSLSVEVTFYLRAAGRPAAGARPGAGDRCTRGRQLVLGLDPFHHTGRSQSA